MAFQYQNTEDVNYSESQNDGYYKPIQEDLPPIVTPDYYPNLIINGAFYKNGEYTDKNGQIREYEFVSLDLIDGNHNTRGSVSISLTTKSGNTRMSELIDLFNLTESDGKTKGFTIKTVNSTNFVEGLSGNKVSAVLDQFEFDGRYIKCVCLGFFGIDGRSVRERRKQVPIEQCRDIENTIRNMLSPRGFPIDVSKQSFDPRQPRNDVNVTVQQSRPMGYQNQNRPPMNQQVYPKRSMPQSRQGPVTPEFMQAMQQAKQTYANANPQGYTQNQQVGIPEYDQDGNEIPF